MQNVGLNGHLDTHQDDQGSAPAFTQTSSHTNIHLVNGDSIERSPPLLDERTPSNDREDDGPPLKRRKIAESNKSTPRPVSPPWKRVQAEGPTTFVEDGRRKSGRTNAVPLELQPQSNKRQTRTAFHKQVGDQKFAKPSYALSHRKPAVLPPQQKDTTTPTSKRGPGRPPKRTESPDVKRDVKMQKQQSPAAARIAQLEAQLAKLKQEKHSAERRRRRSSTQDEDLNGFIKQESDDSDNEAASSSDMEVRVPTPPVTLRKVAFRVNLPKPTIATPANFPPPKHYDSFEEFLQHDATEYRAGQDLLSANQIRREATIRIKVREGQLPGGIIQNGGSDRPPDAQLEPKRQYAHHDHLLAHVVHFRKLLREERRTHRKQAELLAHECKRYLENKARKTRVKTKEELEQEEYHRNLAAYRTVVKDVDKLWSAVLAEVQMQRQREYEEQQQAKMKGHLARVLDRTDQMLNRNSELDSSMIDSGEEGEAADSDEDSEDSEQMSQSGSESSSGTEPEDDDAGLTEEQLRRKYANIPDVEKVTEFEVDVSSRPASTAGDAGEDSDPETEMDSEFDTDESGEGNSEEVDEEAGDTGPGLLSLFSQQEVYHMAPEDPDTPDHVATEADEVDAAQGTDEDDSDPDIEMDSEFDTEESEEDSEKDDQDDDVATKTEDATGSLLSLFSKQEIDEMAPDNSDNAQESAGLADGAVEEPSSRSTPLIEEMDAEYADPEIAAEEAHLDQDMKTDQEESKSAMPQQLAEVIEEAKLLSDSRGSSEDQVSHEPSTQASPIDAPEPESVSSVEPHHEAIDTKTDDEQSSIQTPVPSLLRGTLRIYQHEGLDWLANLYANGRSGILADEMGLGKTIQSIALLAHLAEVHEVWGPHLIVVPTSVMLNWEMEFKKFLPGFKILTYYGSLDERKQKRRGWMADDSFNVCITSYQLVLQDANSFKRRRWHYMILDEAHNIKNFRSERWQTMMTFNTQARLLLTGTPLQNNLTELWSLLFFLHYGQEQEGEDDAFAGLQEWSQWFKRPVESILEHNNQVLDEEDKEQVAKLHKVIRPFLLRRMKRDVEKQMPLKYEHVEMCRLSKRQRQLYDGFMSRAQTKETLASGNYLSIINALMQLRKVCNHPDLFETRPINTSFTMPKSVAAEFEIQDLLVRRRLVEGEDRLNLGFLQLVPICNEKMSMIDFQESTGKHAYYPLKALYDKQYRRSRVDNVWHGERRISVLTSLENAGRSLRLGELSRIMYVEAYRHHEHPMYGRGLIERLTISTNYDKLAKLSGHKAMARFWEREDPASALTLVQSIQTRSERMQSLVEKYACLTPAAVANDFSTLAITEAGSEVIRRSEVSASPDPFHAARMKLSIAFPDKRLLQYDCGKLQRLDKLLRQLQSGGHRALIFTQMTKVLDILEQFLNIHGHRYLRLDGATKIEQRQMLTERFNNDNRILTFILSSRSGGLGINLTGADTVIFYDLDWNPAMDKQCTDRAHRIGQTRDVHIYRFVSEHTIESNILRKANQKQLLDDVVIQEGDFTTDYLNKTTYKDMLDEEAEEDVAGAAMDRVLGNERTNVTAFEQAEDREDIAAAKVAAKEVQHADDGDFEDKNTATPREAQTPGPMAATNAALAEATDADGRHVDEYMIKLQRYILRDVPLGPRKDRSKKGKKRRDEHRVRRLR